MIESLSFPCRQSRYQVQKYCPGIARIPDCSAHSRLLLNYRLACVLRVKRHSCVPRSTRVRPIHSVFAQWKGEINSKCAFGYGLIRIVGTNALRGPLALDSSKSVWPCDAGSSSHEVHAASRPGPSELCPGGAERGPTS